MYATNSLPTVIGSDEHHRRSIVGRNGTKDVVETEISQFGWDHSGYAYHAIRWPEDIARKPEVTCSDLSDVEPATTRLSNEEHGPNPTWTGRRNQVASSVISLAAICSGYAGVL